MTGHEIGVTSPKPKATNGVTTAFVPMADHKSKGGGYGLVRHGSRVRATNKVRCPATVTVHGSLVTVTFYLAQEAAPTPSLPNEFRVPRAIPPPSIPNAPEPRPATSMIPMRRD